MSGRERRRKTKRGEVECNEVKEEMRGRDKEKEELKTTDNKENTSLDKSKQNDERTMKH